MPADPTSPRSSWPVRHVARVTIRFLTPFAVRSGRGDLFSDSVFVTDANGLPAIPGTSIAGVLRHAAAAALGDGTVEQWDPDSQKTVPLKRVEHLFGTAAAKDRDAGFGSRLSVSWAAIHGADDRPVDGLRDPYGPIAEDPVLENARAGVLRDHVRIDHRGGPADRGKFEETLVAAGHRFTVELVLSGTAEDESVMDRLLGLLSWPGLRLGAGTRRGHGAFAVVAVRRGAFDLRDEAGFDGFSALPVDLGDPGRLGAADLPTPVTPTGSVAIVLEGFGPRDRWLFGGGVAETGEDFAPVAEQLVTWEPARSGGWAGRVTAQPVHVVPASGIKGALAHRLSWHRNLLAARRGAVAWATERDGPDSPTVTGAENPAVLALFGRVKNKDGEGRAGRLLLDDLFLTDGAVRSAGVFHVSQDRFTGGARRGRLFSERVLEPGPRLGEYRMTLMPRPKEADPDDEVESLAREAEALDALAATLVDLRRGRLFFGAGSSRGNGRFGCTGLRVEGEGELADGLRARLAALGEGGGA